MRSGTIVFGAILLLVARPAASGAQDLRTILEAQLDAAAPTIVGGGYVPDPAAIDTEMIVAPADGRAILFIRMVSCDTNPCAFGYRVYRR